MTASSRVMGDRKGAPERQQQVLDVLIAQGRPMSRSELHALLWRKQTIGQVGSATRSLLVLGAIEVVEQSTGGHHRTTFQAVAAERRVG